MKHNIYVITLYDKCDHSVLRELSIFQYTVTIKTNQD